MAKHSEPAAEARLSLHWTRDCTGRCAGSFQTSIWETPRHFVAVEREMKVVLVFLIMLLAAVTALAYGQAGGAAGITGGVLPPWTEPAALLLSGGALLGIAGAVRRLPF